ncbi:MAG: hypothetical protein ACJ8HU_09490 [Chthoniobacterales bacterium]|jgi:quercetin dioxygenase-like cupin family protein
MPEVDFGDGEFLSTYIKRIEDAERDYFARFPDRGIVLSTDIEPVVLRQGEITRTQILWRVYQHPMAYIVNAPAGTKVPEHSHDEDIFRLMMSGALVVSVNGEEYKIDDSMWFVVRAGFRYSIRSDAGYKALVTYTFVCAPATRR